MARAPGEHAECSDGDIDQGIAIGADDERGDEGLFALLAAARQEARRDGRIAVRSDQADHGGKAGDG